MAWISGRLAAIQVVARNGGVQLAKLAGNNARGRGKKQ
jgi:hypothetical protein